VRHARRHGPVSAPARASPQPIPDALARLTEAAERYHRRLDDAQVAPVDYFVGHQLLQLRRFRRAALFLRRAARSRQRLAAAAATLLVEALNSAGDWQALQRFLGGPDAARAAAKNGELARWRTVAPALLAAKRCEQLAAGDRAKAARCYRALATRYPDTPLAVRARTLARSPPPAPDHR